MKTYWVAGLKIEVPSQVYSPSEDTFLLLKLLDKQVKNCPHNLQRKRLLEVGCGSGLVTIYSRRIFSPAIIIATDVNPSAIKTTLENIRRNDENINDYQLVQTDICRCFSTSTCFDLAMINPPYLPCDNNWISPRRIRSALEGGPTGTEVLNSFLAEINEQLCVERIAYVYSNLMTKPLNTDCLIQSGYEIQDQINQQFADETLTAIMWTRSS